MPWRFHLLIAALTAYPFPCTAQTRAAASSEAENLRIANSRPVAGISIDEPFSERWRILTFYPATASDDAGYTGLVSRRYFVRRAVGSNNGQTTVTWAREETCPTLRGAVAWMSMLEMPRPNMSGITPIYSPTNGGPPPNVPTDPPLLSFWSTARQSDNSFGRVQADVYGGPIGEWFDATERNLADCWTDQAPE